MTALDLDIFMPYRLATTANAVSSLIASEYARQFGLKISEWRMIAILGQEQPRSQNQLVDLTRTDKVTVSRAIKALSARGLVARSPSPDDGRSHLLELTQAGRAMFDAITPLALGMERQIISVLSQAERAKLMDILTKLLDHSTRLIASGDHRGETFDRSPLGDTA